MYCTSSSPTQKHSPRSLTIERAKQPKKGPQHTHMGERVSLVLLVFIYLFPTFSCCLYTHTYFHVHKACFLSLVLLSNKRQNLCMCFHVPPAATSKLHRIGQRHLVLNERRRRANVRLSKEGRAPQSTQSQSCTIRFSHRCASPTNKCATTTTNTTTRHLLFFNTHTHIHHYHHHQHRVSLIDHVRHWGHSNAPSHPHNTHNNTTA